MEFIDTHCHIHSDFYKLDPDMVIKEAREDGIIKAICVGEELEDSVKAIEFVAKRDGLWASVGIHPHEAKDYPPKSPKLEEFSALATRPKVVAIGECGLDFYYNHSPKEDQARLLHLQIELALKHDLPMIFHVRDAFKEFWPVFDQYKGIRGVMHSFTATKKELEQVLSRGLYVGQNGIITFTKKAEQLEAAKAIPLDKIVLETDAPFLTPAPYRGIIAQLKHVRVTAKFLAELRGESLQEFAASTTRNATKLFQIS
jgi:TatD DNase family protein